MSSPTWRRRCASAAAVALTGSLALVPTSAPAADSPVPARAGSLVGPNGGLWAPQRIEVHKEAGAKNVWIDPGLNFVAGDAALEFRTKRPSYSEGLVTTWTSGPRSGTLPAGTPKSFSGLNAFVKHTLRDKNGKVVATRANRVCFGEGASRARPDAPAFSPYPKYACGFNPYTLGTVQGLQAGWAQRVSWGLNAKIGLGRYTLTSSVTKQYADSLGLAAADRTRTTTVVVRKPADDGHHHLTGPRTAQRPQAPTARPAASEPTSARAGSAAGTKPDLRSLPAWDVSTNNKGNLLRFAATVWNGGDSPMVVDGFRGADESVMDAYQYFFDAEGNQTGYERVGEIKFHGGNHQHWHFQDFARYRLLKADKTPVVTSGKVSFCLANTDAVDYTVAGADWNPTNTDLSTDCGEPGSLSLREVLSAGSGDTYAQFRTGQAFNIAKLPKGWYWISVEANPSGRLVEHDTTNNTSLRKVFIGGKPGGRRTVKVPQIGIIDESQR